MPIPASRLKNWVLFHISVFKKQLSPSTYSAISDQKKIHPLKLTYIASENRPCPPKEIHLSTFDFRGHLLLVSGRVNV